MFHHVAGSIHGPLFATWSEGLALWRLLAALPDRLAICVMPDHVHVVLPHDDPGRKLGNALGAHARWRNHRRRTDGPIWRPRPEPRPIANRSHLQRTIRYIHLNPCRSQLVDDPLSWPFSTHRDLTGIGARPILDVAPDPDDLHRFVSSDGTVRPTGTALPSMRYTAASWPEVRAAVSAMCRVEASRLTTRGPWRTLAIRTAWFHGLRDAHLLASTAKTSRARVYAAVRDLPSRGADVADPALAACVRVVGDRRFQALCGDVHLEDWRPWRRPAAVDADPYG